MPILHPPAGLSRYGAPAVRFRAALAMLLLATGCAPQGHPNDFGGLERAERSVPATGRTTRAALLVNGRAIPRDAFVDALAEAAGATVIQEVALERLLEEAFERRGLSLSDADVEAERVRLRSTLDDQIGQAGVSRDAVLDDIRRSRGLGPSRFDALLRRNAMLRTLVRDDVEATITNNDLMTAFEIRHGRRHAVRLLLSPDRDTVARAHGALSNPGHQRTFGELAAMHSADASAQRGGLLDPISLADPAYEQALLDAIAQLTPGALSPVFALQDGYAFVRLESVTPPSGRTFDAVRDQLTREVRLVRQRAYMDRLARALISDATITVGDPALRWSWQTIDP